MAIQTEIDRIEDGKAFLRAAIIDKTHGIVPTPHQSLDDYSSIINNIDLGGEMTDEVKEIVNRTAKSVVVPASVGFLRACVFYGCTSLEEIVMLPTAVPSQEQEWYKNTNDCVIYVPDDSVITYQNEWQDLASRIKPLSTRTKTYDFANATVDNEVIPTDSTKSRMVKYINGGTVRTLRGWMPTEYDGIYVQGNGYNNLFWNKRTGTYNGLFNNASGNRAFSIDTRGYNTIKLNNGSSTAWTSDSFPYVENGGITIKNDGMSATIMVNQGATKVDVTAIQNVTISSMVFRM